MPSRRRLLPLLAALLVGAGLAPEGLVLPSADGGESVRKHASLVVDRPSHDFGVVAQNTVHKATFTYTNAGKEVVEGIAARGECGCNVVAVSRTRLAPGESGTLEVEFNTVTLGGRMEKRIHLRSKDYRDGELTIPLKIAIVKGLIVRPMGVTYGDVPLGTHPTKEFYLKWYEGEGEPFEITSVTVPGYDFEAKVTPYKSPKDPRWGGWTVAMTMHESPPLGNFSAEVLVRTTNPEHPRLTMPLSANVSGRIWFQARTMTFGSFDAGTERNASLKFKPFGKDVTFGKVSAVARKGLIEVEVKPDPYHAAKGVWRLYGRVPASAEAGSLDDEVIELHTGVPGEEVTLIKVKGTVRAPRGSAGDGR
jgi:hypothetical protein